MNVLVLEASTSSAKAMLYNDRQGVLAMDSVPYSAKTGGPNMHDMDSLFDQLASVGACVASGRDVSCIALVGSWHTLVVADQDWRPLFCSYTWASDLGGHVAESMRGNRETLKQMYCTTGCVPNATYPLYKLLALKEQGLDTSACRIMDENAFLFHLLTGEWKTTACAASGSSMLNICALDWDQGALSLMGVTKSQLPALTSYLDTAPLSQSAARKLSLPAGIPVVVPEPDGAMNQLGAGAMRPGIMTLSVGTSAAIRCISKEPVFSEDYANWCYYAPGTYLVGAATAGSTNCVNWFRSAIGAEASFDRLEAGVHLTQKSPYFLPFLYGERCPGWSDQRSGVFAGLTSSHAIHDLYGAVLEGVIHNIYDCYCRLCKAMGEPNRILLSGGVLRSKKWSSMLVNTFQRSVVASEVDQMSLLGGAAMALAAAGALDSLACFTPNAREYVIEPEEEAIELARERFAAYRLLYEKGI